MAKFEINTSKCKNYLSDLGSTEKELKNIKSDVDKVLNILNQIK